MLRERLPVIRARGFTGLMLDTLDMPPWLEQIDPVADRDMGQASIELVQAVRQASPDMFIVVNRGYAILPQLCSMVDAVLAKSLLTSPDPGVGFVWNSPGDVEMQLALLAPAGETKPPLPILSLDDWNPADAAGLLGPDSADPITTIAFAELPTYDAGVDVGGNPVGGVGQYGYLPQPVRQDDQAPT